jgi:hypothetical protein
MVEEIEKLKVGDKIYQCDGCNIVGKYIIVKVTKTLAISQKGTKFTNNKNNIRRVPYEIWSHYFYELETPKLKELYNQQKIRSEILKTIKNVSWEEVENNVIIDILKIIKK